ncbi:hypothetical protein C8J56DRAFT_812753 [Mycena floridula]|nr:hypothetical protein C8J56DRAFT_812753 [Mycena floridula]
MTSDNPPAFEPTNVVELTAIDDSKLVSVSLYSSRAEITRLYKVPVVIGLNQVTISGLPSVLDQDSLKVEGRGAATIHDVVISHMPEAPVATSSPELVSLLEKKEKTENALGRCRKGLESLETYLGTLSVQHIDSAVLSSVLERYDTAGEVLHNRVSALNKDLLAIESQIEQEKERLAGGKDNGKLKIKASVGVFADAAGEVQIVLIYAVHSASWVAAYDIRADLENEKKPITMIYKAVIKQDTGEDWNDVPLILETATPSFGAGIPTLTTWNLSISSPYAFMRKESAIRGMRASNSAPGGNEKSRRLMSMSTSFARDETIESSYGAPMEMRETSVSSKGNVNATFHVPGLVSIPSDDASHNFTIVKLDLEANVTWLCVPKHDPQVHLKAEIKNSSEFSFLPGTASVYVDGSFISRKQIPAVSPKETFDCSLGLDPSIRVTYPRCERKRSETGILGKTAKYDFIQRVAIHNTKTVPVKLKVMDQFPVSENSDIVVKLLNPSLTVPATRRFRINDTVTAQWMGLDGPERDSEVVGKDGKIEWICDLGALSKMNLNLQWEVAAPAKEVIENL